MRVHTWPPRAFVVISIFLAGCVDEPVSPYRHSPHNAAAAIADEAISEDPVLLAIAREVPHFAGYYYAATDPEVLIVAVTDLARGEQARTAVRSSWPSIAPPARIDLAHVTHSFLELARYRTALRQSIFDIPDVVSLGVKESTNRIRIGVRDSSAVADVLALVRTLDIPETAVVIARVPTPMLTSTLGDAQPQGLIQGGWRIGSETGWSTLGFAAVRWSNGDPVFVTCSHCTETLAAYDGGWIAQPWLTIGFEILDPDPHDCGLPNPGELCRRSDAALISPEASIHLGRIARTVDRVTGETTVGDLTIDSLNPTLTITSAAQNVVENEVLDKIGATTGWTYGAVEETCEDIKVDDLVRECSDIVDFNARGGDSGSPVFKLKQDGTVELRGIVWGRIGWPHYDTAISDLGQISQDLGTLLTVDAQLSSSILGPSEVPPSAACGWEAHVNPGWPPFTYEWRRDGALVSTSNVYYTESTGAASFGLTLRVIDLRSDTAQSVMSVTIDEGQLGALTCTW